MFENLLTPQQYADLTRYNVRTVRAWIARGQLPVIEVAGRKFVTRSSKPKHSVRAEPQKGNPYGL